MEISKILSWNDVVIGDSEKIIILAKMVILYIFFKQQSEKVAINTIAKIDLAKLMIA